MSWLDVPVVVVVVSCFEVHVAASERLHENDVATIDELDEQQRDQPTSVRTDPGGRLESEAWEEQSTVVQRAHVTTNASKYHRRWSQRCDSSG
jgi:hypothetical protein